MPTKVLVPEMVVDLDPPSTAPAHVLLAVGVLRQAVADIQDPSLPRATRSQAHHFLTGHSPRLTFWCEMAGLNPELVRHRAARFPDPWQSTGPDCWF